MRPESLRDKGRMSTVARIRKEPKSDAPRKRRRCTTTPLRVSEAELEKTKVEHCMLAAKRGLVGRDIEASGT